MRKPSRWIPVFGGAIVGGIIALVLVIGLNGHKTKTQTTTVIQQPATRAQPAAFAGSNTGKSINQIYKEASPGVVDIVVTAKASGNSLGGLFGQGGQGGGETAGEGAGVVYNDKGYILTDQHVVANATSVKVNFNTGKVVSAKVVGTDPATDVGVIKVDVPSSELHPVPLANSDSAQVGDPVVAIGSPFSQPETVTSGIVSQTGRSIKAPNRFTIAGAIQTDAAINPGNSGGPLLNANGQVLGLNDQIETTNTGGGEGSSSGIGFATPGNSVKQVADELIAGKTVHHSYVGASLQPGQSTVGAQIACIQPGGPASQSGLEVNDVVTKIDSTTVSSEDQFIATLSSDYKPGQSVTLTVKRGGQTKQIKLTIGTQPAQAPTTGPCASVGG